MDPQCSSWLLGLTNTDQLSMHDTCMVALQVPQLGTLGATTGTGRTAVEAPLCAPAACPTTISGVGRIHQAMDSRAADHGGRGQVLGW
jgi:hypothetical protein